MSHSEMVERVALGLWDEWQADVVETVPFSVADEESQAMWRGLARAAIAAMREPTAEMLRGGLCGWNGVGIDHELSKYQSADETWEAWRRAWRGMIDAATADAATTAPANPKPSTGT